MEKRKHIYYKNILKSLCFILKENLILDVLCLLPLLINYLKAFLIIFIF